MGNLITEELRTAVMLELDRITQSAEFRQSEQSKRLLTYLVEHTLDGKFELLRERAIGMALFGRADGYDTNESPIVRVRANEIRKRLAKYYQEHGNGTRVQLEVPAGGYKVELRQVGEPVEAAAAEPVAKEAVIEPLAAFPAPPEIGRPARWRRWTVGVLAAVAAVAAGVGIYGWTSRGGDAVADFWRPALEDPNAVILCTGHPVVYRFTRQFEARQTGDQLDHYRSLTEPLQLRPDEQFTGRDVVPVRDQYVGLGSAYAVARIHGWLASHKKDSEIRFGNDLTFTDLRKAPAVLLGAFQNKWSLELSRNLRFVFTTADGVPSVRDTQSGRVWSLPQLKDDGQTDHDYLIISRVFRSETGQFVVLATPITQYGCRAAGDILTNPGPLREALAGLKDWKTHNLQLVFEVSVIAQTAGPPRLIASHVW